ncbi:MAG: translation elongation factor Ts [Candidatus Gracilibacteria bacterium]|jgi:elongation factor Ts
MSVSIDQIKKLRDRTGISMTACKSALEEANGDEEKAIEVLRKKGETKAAERADRATSNGVVAIVQEDNKAAMISLACETDFVAKNEDFIKKAQALAQKLLKEGENADLSNEIADLNIQLGEKIEVKERKVISGPKLDSYTHLNNRIGVLVSMSDGESELMKDIAMHIAAMNPKTLSPEDISADLVSKEKEIWQELLKQEGKPEQIWEKIMEGKEKKFREEFALLTQPFVKNPDQLIKDLIGSNTINEFWRFEV